MGELPRAASAIDSGPEAGYSTLNDHRLVGENSDLQFNSARIHVLSQAGKVRLLCGSACVILRTPDMRTTTMRKAR